MSIIIFSFLIWMNYTVLTVFFRKPRRLDFGNAKLFPKVSILKPIKHSDDELGNNLETFFLLDYPNFEIIFGIDSIEDETDRIIENLRKKYPKVSIKIVPVGKGKILNPKVETLISMEKESSGSVFWISDSNTRVEKDTLKNLIHEYVTKNSKIVFSPVRGMGSKTAGSVIENAYLSFFISGNIIGAWEYLRIPIIIGKSMLVEKAALSNLGGFEYFKQFLAEDYVMGNTFYKNNIYISTNHVWITNFNSHSSIKSFCSRISRWAKMRYHLEKLMYMGEIFVNPIGLSIISIIFLGSKGVTLLLGAVLFKIVLEYLNFFAVNIYDRKNIWVILILPFCVVLKDILLLFIYFIPFFSSRVVWRGKHIKIGRESKIFIEGE
ncbi:MAG: glycosyltransferase [Elusimicrobia bacterium]|nr:glycosyltransferase [Elusimicrobiota bacterium]